MTAGAGVARGAASAPAPPGPSARAAPGRGRAALAWGRAAEAFAAAARAWPLHTLALGLVAALAIAWTVAGAIHQAAWPLARGSGPHQSVSAHFLVIARAFAQAGLGALHGLPLENNLPAGVHPDYYLHWPPLFSYLFGGVVAVAGASEAAGRILMLGILLAGSLALFLLVRRLAGIDAALLAALAYLCLPIVVVYELLVLPLSLALVLAILSVHLYLRAVQGEGRGWGALGAVAIAVAVATSWEAALLPPVLLAAAWSRERAQLRLAGVYVLAAAASGATVLAWYALNLPGFSDELLATVRFRAGLGAYATAEPQLFGWSGATSYGAVRALSFAQIAHVYADRLRWGLGSAGVVAVALVPAILLARRLPSRAGRGVLALLAFAWVFWFLDLARALAHQLELLRTAPGAAFPGGLARLATIALVLSAALGLLASQRDRARDAPLAFAALAGPWVLWFVGMSNHVLIHDYQLLLAAPATAGAVGVVAARGWPLIARPAFARAALVALALLLLEAAGPALRRRRAAPTPADDAAVVLGRDLRVSTPPAAVVLQAENSLVPLFYSERTTVRGALTPEIVARMRLQAAEDFPGRALLLAIPPGPIPPALRALAASPGARRAPGGSVLVPLDGPAGAP